MRKLSKKQIEMLRDFERDGEATDICSFDYFGPSLALAWRNRESVIESLHRRKLLDENGITDAGRAALDALEPAEGEALREVA